jgi:RNA-directed DNA polymerase
VLTEEYEMDWYQGDDLFAVNRQRGLPIGNLTSQFWANVYLNSFDHFVKRDLKCLAFVRYVDDFLLFADDTQTLVNWRNAVIQKMAGLRLSLHEESAQVYPTRTGIPFLGFRVYPEYRLLKRRKIVHFRRKLRDVLLDYANGSTTIQEVGTSIKGWINHVRYANTWGLRKDILGGVQL